MGKPNADEAPDGFWEDFGKFCAEKLNLFDEFNKKGVEAPSPEPVEQNADDETPKVKRKSWFSNE